MITRDDILRAMAGQAWALDRRTLDALLLAGSAEDLRQAAATRRARMAAPRGSTAVIPIVGVLTRRASWWTDLFGGTSTAEAAAAVGAALADPEVSRIVLLVDSPGGTVDGTPELAAVVRIARATKPVVAVVEGMAASAAYWVAAQATSIVVSQSSDLGSIGVYSTHIDLTRANEKAGITPTLIAAPGPEKVELSPLVVLSKDAREYEQGLVDKLYYDFLADVALGRRVDRATVRTRFGGGRLLLARDAIAAGMADRIGSLEEILAAPPATFEAERRARAGLRPPTFAQEQAARRRRRTAKARVTEGN